ncbi:MAG TPA: hypothetical protein DEA43_03445 [Candidatus Moranbacteria bacterium]|nr:hypothetical protein [Candidatus Moranbacteria bacterium]HBT45910.1 hypothetical protein [Candidatus Moranbacteria bacterium]
MGDRFNGAVPGTGGNSRPKVTSGGAWCTTAARMRKERGDDSHSPSPVVPECQGNKQREPEAKKSKIRQILEIITK